MNNLDRASSGELPGIFTRVRNCEECTTELLLVPIAIDHQGYVDMMTVFLAGFCERCGHVQEETSEWDDPEYYYDLYPQMKSVYALLKEWEGHARPINWRDVIDESALSYEARTVLVCAIRFWATRIWGSHFAYALPAAMVDSLDDELDDLLPP